MTDSHASPLETLSAVAQDYLKVVWNAQEWSSTPLSVKELAARLGVTAGTVSEGVRKLADAGLIDHARYGQIALTPQGRRAALAVVRRHRLVETLLVETFGYSWDEVHDEAEVLEHAISDELERRIDDHLGHPTHDPHGDPIPTVDGVISIPAARHLGDLAAGECGVVTRVSDADPELLQRLAQVRVVPGEHVLVTDRDGASALMFVAPRPHEDASGDPEDAAGPGAAPVPFGLAALDHVWVVPG
ncbi:metal-dependent transcriptional regulator [Serinibacter arcticus]|uniref:Manganese transport regulator n=1 Tax=Serinibacter arcticus TaxID=1655435 RepID=A0A4Z1DWN7_9MICO|nr:metal-dependent transcriptional regulator [Serinibacter arcticus]TGO03966.1 Mn-dependent transcriptional regulator MntR [Serinibacter arcticus]